MALYTVADMIADLQKLDPTLPVYEYHAENGDYSPPVCGPYESELEGVTGDSFCQRHLPGCLSEPAEHFKAVVI